MQFQLRKEHGKGATTKPSWDGINEDHVNRIRTRKLRGRGIIKELGFQTSNTHSVVRV